MAWDIYGNKLTPGYCEVHYWIPEEYPCYMCCKAMDEDRQRRDEQYAAELAYNEYVEAEIRKEQEENELQIVTEHAKSFGRFLKIN